MHDQKSRVPCGNRSHRPRKGAHFGPLERRDMGLEDGERELRRGEDQTWVSPLVFGSVTTQAKSAASKWDGGTLGRPIEREGGPRDLRPRADSRSGMAGSWSPWNAPERDGSF
jgi:hypothetical protein